MIVDSHCHLDFAEFDSQREQVLQRARAQGVEKIIVPGVRSTSWHNIKQLCQQYTQCFPAYGLHPYFIAQHKRSDIDLLEQWLHLEQPIGVGECGLDFYLQELDRNKQCEFFEAQLALAERYNLPVIIHSRKATEQVIQILRGFRKLRGMIHS